MMLSGVGTSVGPLCREGDLPDLSLVEDLLLIRLRWRWTVVVRHNAFLRNVFKSKNDHFAKTGSGQA